MIQVKNLSRKFGNILAVDDLSFTVKKGDVLGFLGPNGAGKSTTMKMITGFLEPSSGSVSVAGSPASDFSIEFRHLIGYLPENAPLYGDMTVKGFLSFIADIRNVQLAHLSGSKDGLDDKNRFDKTVELCSLDGVLNQRIETLSKGFKRRVGLAQAIIHDPDYLVMDEPTDGLDPNQKHQVRELIHQMSAEKCIIISTHILEEVEEVCNRAVIINKGKIIADDTPENLKSRAESSGSISVTFNSRINDDVRTKLRAIESISSIDEFDLGEKKTSVCLFPDQSKGKFSLFDLMDELKQFENQIEAFSVSEGKLDEVFRKITSDE